MAVFAGPEIVNNGLALHLDTSSMISRGPSRNINQFGDGDMSSTSSYGLYGPTTQSIVQVSDVPRTNGVSRNVLQLNSTDTKNGGGNHGGFSVGMGQLIPGKEYTVSFYGRVISSNNVALALNYQSGGGQSSQLDKGFTLTTAWQYFEYTATPSNRWSTLFFWNQGTANAIWQIADVFVRESKYNNKYIFLDDYNDSNRLKIFDLSSELNATLINGSNFYYENNIDVFRFDGVNDYSTVSSFPRFTANSDLTIEAFVKPTSMYSYSVILVRGYGSAGYPSYSLGRQNAAGWIFSVGDNTSNYPVIDSDFVALNAWQHVVGVLNRSENTCKIYLNGVLKGTSDATGLGSFEDAAGNLTIGRSINDVSYSYFIGDMNIVKLYDKALTPTEVKQNFEATRTRYGL